MPDSGSPPPSSINGARIPTVTQLVDSAQNVWTVTNGVVDENGQPAGVSFNVTLLLFLNGQIYQQNTNGLWFQWNGGEWNSVSDPRVVSPDKTTSPSAAVIIDGQLDVWTLVDGVVYENGARAGYSADVTLLIDYGGTVYQDNSAGDFWSWNGSTWVAASGDPRSTTPSGQFGIKASGNKLVSTVDGSPVELIGANLSGLENSSGPAMWTPYANTTVDFWQSLKNYQGSGINVVRLQLNSAFWLGYACGYSTAAYQSTVEHVVSAATQAGLYVILVLHWDMPNVNGAGVCPIGQSGMPSLDHAPPFWKSIADIYGNNPAVIFELFNEPFGANTGPEWDNNGAPGTSVPILANGGSFTPLVYQDNEGGNVTMITNNETYQVAGELGLLNTIRAEGATNLVLASTGYWDGDVPQWLNIYNTNGNPDPLKNFGATWHDYNWGTGPSAPLAILAAGYPLVITETYGFDANLIGVVDNSGGSWTTGGAGLNETAGYAFARSQNIGYVCGWQVNDWAPGQTELSLTTTPPWAGCATQ